jgi:hypothetical protein
LAQRSKDGSRLSRPLAGDIEFVAPTAVFGVHDRALVAQVALPPKPDMLAVD